MAESESNWVKFGWIPLLIVVVAILMFARTGQPNQTAMDNVACDKILSGSRFTDCKPSTGPQVRVCQKWGNQTTEGNRTINIRYCEDYHYSLHGDNMSIRRVR